MNETKPTKENTLYLPIKQVYFDAIIEGTKKEEYREVKYGITANRYLLKDENNKFIRNPETTEEGKEYYIDDYNNGCFPFLPKQYKFLYLAVGYAKERDTATVEVTHITHEATRIRGEGDKRFTWWLQVFHIGKIIEVHRKG